MSFDEQEEKENFDTATQFRVQIRNVSSVHTVSIKNQIFVHLKSHFSSCHLIVANNNDKTTFQPHRLDELNSIRIYIKTRMCFTRQIRDQITNFLASFYSHSFDNHFSLVKIQVASVEDKQFSSTVKWVTFGGDHDPRFTTAILPQWFSRYYKINEWAQRNATKKFTLLDEFILSGDTSQGYLTYIEDYLTRYKSNLFGYK